MIEYVLPLAGGALAAAVVMFLAWLYQLRGGKAGIVDVAWTFSVGCLGAYFALFVANGILSRRILLAVLVQVWSWRLGCHLLRRVFSHAEDERYVRLRASWGKWREWRMLLFYQSQALASPLFALPMLVAGRSPTALNVWDGLAVAIWLSGMLGEWQADRQLSAFRAAPENRGRVCQVGWWRYSRHPNYFFEWLVWCSYVPFAIDAPAGWLALLAPAAMFYFLYFVTGIPPAEAQALASRGAAYREYQRTTSPFLPWPPRQDQSGK